VLVESWFLGDVLILGKNGIRIFSSANGGSIDKKLRMGLWVAAI
jgi:hypothetical protein